MLSGSCDQAPVATFGSAGSGVGASVAGASVGAGAAGCSGAGASVAFGPHAANIMLASTSMDSKANNLFFTFSSKRIFILLNISWV